MQLERDVADFVEEERAPIGELEATDFLVDGTGEGAALVAEEFGFEKTGRNGGAIHFDEGTLFARAEIVDGAGDDFLAGAGFAEDENGAAGGSDELDLGHDATDRGAVADNFFEVVGAANLFFEVELFFGEFCFQRVDVFEGDGVFDGDGDLCGDLLDEFDVGGREAVGAAAGEIERAERAATICERDAANNLHAFRAKQADDLAGVLIHFSAARDERAIFDDGAAGGRRFARDGELGFDERLAARKIERVNFEEAVGGIEQGEAGVVVMNDALERGDDAAEEFVGFEAGDEDVVDFEKDAEAIAFTGELRLIGLSVFEIERVVHGDGDLAGDALHEGELAVFSGDAARDEAAETHGAEAALRGGERYEREAADAFIAEALHEFGVALFFGGVADDESFLGAPDFTGRVTVDGGFGADMFVVGDARFENVETHDVADGIVEREGEEIEIDDGVEALGEIVEECGEVTLLRDGFADFEKGFELAA